MHKPFGVFIIGQNDFFTHLQSPFFVYIGYFKRSVLLDIDSYVLNYLYAYTSIIPYTALISINIFVLIADSDSKPKYLLAIISILEKLTIVFRLHQLKEGGFVDEPNVRTLNELLRGEHMAIKAMKP